MAWTAHRVVLRLRSPMHIGAGKVGNLQRTRPYVTGRNLWGALTARLTRDEDEQGKPEPQRYREIGDRVHDKLAFTYFFPTKGQRDTIALWPWDDGFRYTFLSTYAGTALDYARTAAQEASLHEVECITPHTRDGEAVYLTGYIFQAEASNLNWQSALHRLQVGGERGYGWGHVEPVGNPQPASKVFNHTIHLDGKRPRVELSHAAPLLAHALAADFDREDQALPGDAVDGPVEPLVGRETGTDTRFGVHLSQARICYAPGGHITKPTTIQVGRFGVWEQNA